MTEQEVRMAKLKNLLNFSPFFYFFLVTTVSVVSTVLLKNIKVMIMNCRKIKFERKNHYFDVVVELTSFSVTM